MTFQEQNRIYRMKQKHSTWNLTEKSGMDQNLKWDEHYFILFYFLN
jgi:hypothetical protein